MTQPRSSFPSACRLAEFDLDELKRGLAKLAVERETYNLMEQDKTGLLNETIRVPTGDDERISLATLPDGPVVVIIRHAYGQATAEREGAFHQRRPLRLFVVQRAARRADGIT